MGDEWGLTVADLVEQLQKLDGSKHVNTNAAGAVVGVRDAGTVVYLEVPVADGREEPAEES